MKALVEQHHGLPVSPLVSLIVPNQNLDLLGQQAADGRTPPRCQYFGFPNRLLRKADCKILLGHKILIYTQYTCITYCACCQRRRQKKKISIARMAVLLKTSRSQIDRILDSVKSRFGSSLQQAAALVGHRVVTELV
jgi:hypothetical protein